VWNHVHVVLWTMTFLIFVTAAAFVVFGRRWVRSLISFVAAAAVFQILTLLQPSLVVATILVVALFLMLRGPGRDPRVTQTVSVGVGSDVLPAMRP
jgi:uncharacterized membrane protein YjjP (DUF1212 family)